MQILKKTRFNWSEIRIINKFYTYQGVKERMDQGETRSVKVRR